MSSIVLYQSHRMCDIMPHACASVLVSFLGSRISLAAGLLLSFLGSSYLLGSLVAASSCQKASCCFALLCLYRIAVLLLFVLMVSLHVLLLLYRSFCVADGDLVGHILLGC